MSAPKDSAGVLSTVKRREKHAPLPGSLLDKEERKFHSLLVLYRGDITHNVPKLYRTIRVDEVDNWSYYTAS